MRIESLAELRARIDTIDDEIIQLVLKRIEVSNLIMKSKPPAQIVDSQREQGIVERYTEGLAKASTPLKAKRLALGVVGASSVYPE